MSPRVIVHLVCLFRLDLVQARVLCSVLDVINALNENTDTTQSTGAGQSRCLTVFNYGGP